MFRYPAPWRQQPPIGTPVDRRWMGEGLVALFDVRAARELISGDYATTISSTLFNGVQGQTAGFSTTANQQYAHRAAYATTDDFSVVVTMDISSSQGAYGPIISKLSSPTTDMPYELRLGSGSSAGDINLGRATSSLVETHLTSSVISAGFAGTFVLTCGLGLNPDVYLNGLKLTHTAPSRGASSDTGSAVWIGRRSDGSTQLNGRIYQIALFNRVIPEGPAFLLAANPWLLREPEQRTIYSTVAGGAPAFVSAWTMAANTVIQPGVRVA